MAVVEYSFKNPMKAYKQYTSPLREDQMTAFKVQFEKPVQFKSAQFWVASYTGINNKNADENTPALAVSNCFGYYVVFPYKYQNFMLKLLDGDSSAGLAKAVDENKVIGPFNWKAVTTNSLLVGYAIAMSNKEISLSDWGTEEYKRYFKWSQSIKNGKVKGTFIPNYLCPQSLMPEFKYALLYSRGVLGIGCIKLQDYSDGRKNPPSLLIPDIDFVTQFDLTAFSSLGLGGIYKDYVSKLTSTAVASGRLVACNSPRPASIDLSHSVAAKKDEPKKDEAKKDEPKKSAADVKAGSAKLLTVIAEALNKSRLTSTSELKLVNKEVTLLKDVVECKVALTKSSDKGYYPNSIAYANLIKDNVPQFKPKSKQHIYLNFVVSLEGNTSVNVKRSLGLYGSGLVNMNLGADKMLISDFVNSFSSLNVLKNVFKLDDSYLVDNFDVQVIDGIHDVVMNDNYTRCSVISETEKEYKVVFKISDSEERILKIQEVNTGLRYTVSNDKGEDLAVYTGDEDISVAVSSVIKATV